MIEHRQRRADHKEALYISAYPADMEPSAVFQFMETVSGVSLQVRGNCQRYSGNISCCSGNIQRFSIGIYERCSSTHS